MNERIRLLRKTLNMTQAQFASRIGSKQSTIATYESGRSDPLEAVVLSICREFDVNEDWLRYGGDESLMFNQRTEEDEALYEAIGKLLTIKDPNSKKAMIRWIMSMTPEDVEMCLYLAQKLVQAFEDSEE